jgi:hypothetical protein
MRVWVSVREYYEIATRLNTYGKFEIVLGSDKKGTPYNHETKLAIVLLYEHCHQKNRECKWVSLDDKPYFVKERAEITLFSARHRLLQLHSFPNV